MLSQASDYFQTQFDAGKTFERPVVKKDTGRVIFPTTSKWCSLHNRVHASNTPYVVVSEVDGAVYSCPSDPAARSSVPWSALPESVRHLYGAAMEDQASY